ncbi:MAG: FAD-dependent oxidoreductase [Parashewanella sp.]
MDGEATNSKVKPEHDQVLIIGGGIAGICAAIELLDSNISVTLIDRDAEGKFGGMANEAFGGMLLVDTPHQRRNGIKDSKQLALDDWMAAAQFPKDNVHGVAWAKTYVERCKVDIFDWLTNFGIKYFPIVHWVERGNYGFGEGQRGNSVPRYHITWGTGWHLTQTLIKQLKEHPQQHLLKLHFNRHVEQLIWQDNTVTGCIAFDTEDSGRKIEFTADNVILCCGGINGNLEQVKKYWDSDCYGSYPDNMLSGSHPYADGYLHDELKKGGGSIKNLGWMWNYASGIAHPKPEYENHGLSVIPPRSSLWLNAHGRRVGPLPMVTGYDTHQLCAQTGQLPHQYTWQLMNRAIAVKELSVSGSHINPIFKNRSIAGVLKMALKGNPELIDWLCCNAADIVVADTIEELIKKMQLIVPEVTVDKAGMLTDINNYDEQVVRGTQFATDDQIRKIASLRQWKGDKARTLKQQTILDESAGPLIAIRSRVISRKSMGGMETNTDSQVLNQEGNVISGLYAAGEAAGFGGAGSCGRRSLEGTFLSGAILNGRIAAQHIATKIKDN